MAADKGVLKPRVSRVVTPEVKPPSWADFRRSESQPVKKPTVSAASVSALGKLGLITPGTMSQLAAAGVKYSVADTMQVAGGGGGPAAHYDFARNTIYYNPRTARTAEAYKGVMEHELVHAATANIPGLGKDLRSRYLYSFGQAAQGKSPLASRLLHAIPFLVAKNTAGRLFGSIAEGIADRSGAYPDIPKWGDAIRRNIVGR